MQKLILVNWDMQLGPRTLVQFPPEENFPPKEVLLKIWAQHEINPKKYFISYYDNEQDKYYCSYLKKQIRTIKTYFIVLELSPEDDERIFQEILDNIAEDLINKIDHPHFNHVLSETYRIVKTYSDLDQEQLFLRLFEDKVRSDIFSILRNGVLTKKQLKSKLEDLYGYSDLNVDLLLTPFIRLGLIQINNIPGSPDSLFLVNDVYSCFLPPKEKPNTDIIRDVITQRYMSPKIIPNEDLQPLMHLYQEPGVKELISLLNEDIHNGMPYEIALTVLKNKEDTIEQLEKHNIVFVHNKKRIYLISQLNFIKFVPTYLISILAKRYQKSEISLDQLVQQLDYIKLTDMENTLGANWNRIY
ncbi:hypothetical protein NEF87_000754 [Candidatus Lokiarchaeum ossiferum]|uniref:Uncharacterized protein n=1 Tax=Candidatus Lokiarchaeum ossiferum TaxID=2951803 RepID=A0ABY6HLT6_9ARCH|nr:hypothetical protein NEF87_000754 [Candidatus Lokiarchaeum sp. B-35]